MKILLFILLLFAPLFSYTQEIGSELSTQDREGLLKVEYDHCNKYMYLSDDSTVVYKTRKDDNLIWDIDYLISQEKVENSGLKWVIMYTQVGQNIFYNNDTYYFILFTGTHYLIQIRNANIVWPTKGNGDSPKERVKTNRVFIGQT